MKKTEIKSAIRSLILILIILSAVIYGVSAKLNGSWDCNEWGRTSFGVTAFLYGFILTLIVEIYLAIKMGIKGILED